MINYLKSAINDPLFLRVVMALWGAPFLAIALYVAANASQVESDYWILIFPAALGLFGSWLLLTALTASDKTVDQRTDWLGDGADLIGLVFILVVLIVAVPIWELLKLRTTR